MTESTPKNKPTDTYGVELKLKELETRRINTIISVFTVIVLLAIAIIYNVTKSGVESGIAPKLTKTADTIQYIHIPAFPDVDEYNRMSQERLTK